ncbi:DNA-binding transcriptional regulator, PadR family [Raineyella antarctica]|uniref:DNA-binding transcriptional regulator, PadR family n=1 Tax=Raineyella antarctica TaxID=1577474 RepID=A0A1G6GH53_9ACTN|nr:PadR family transcriptional regulator [Raineyella antarctica]SDB81284.1 DNA-binding transcriptional regulator, PadR family [Raineyella antarctica]
MSLRYAILGVLDAQPMTGYELGSFFETSANWVWSAKLSQIYPLLNAMADEGVVFSEDEVHGRRHSTRYTITEAGRAELREWVGSVHRLPPARDPMLLQALFMDVLDNHAVDGVLDEYVSAMRDRIADLREHQRSLIEGETELIRERMKARPMEEHDRMQMMKSVVFSGMIRHCEVSISWAEDLRVAARLTGGWQE